MPPDDPLQNPKPDYGSLGPGSDLTPPQPAGASGNRWRVLAALAVGALAAVLFAGRGTVRAAWEEISQLLSVQGKPEPASPAVLSDHEIEQLDRASPQSQAELLLERAINHYQGANDQIAARVDGWHGKIKSTTALQSLISTALNSDDLRVRAASIEVNLAVLNVDKTEASIDRLAPQAESGTQAERAWALWLLGLLGNRGVEPGRAGEILTSQLRDSNTDIRYWAVEGLAYLGTDDTIAPLLRTFHDDPSPMIRERAACSLAQSGMLSEKQRRTAIPQLLDFAEDGSLDAQTHTWVYQALRDITGQSLANDPAAWRNWYSTAEH